MAGSIHQLAKRAGVSVATVSRVFNKRPYVRTQIREKVLRLAREMQYTPRLTARKDTIAIIVEGTERINLSGFESYLIVPLTQQLIRAGLHFQIIPVGELDFVHENFIRAAVAIVHQGTDMHRVQEIRSLPVIMNQDCKGVLTIRSDHQQGAELAIDYLVKRGHRKIGLLVTSTAGGGPSELRITGYKAALQRAQIPFEPELVQAFANQTHFEAVAKLLQAGPTAAVVTGEGAALPVTYVLQLLSKKVPAEISLITYEQRDISPYLFPSHTTIAQNFDLLAQTYVAHLLRVLEGEDITRMPPILIPNQLIERDSVRSLS